MLRRSSWVSAVVLGFSLLLLGCGSDKEDNPGPSGSGGSAGEDGGTGGSGNSGGGSGGTGGGLGSICIMHDCASDAECEGCPDTRIKCNTTEKRCVQCLPDASTTTCVSGKVCSQYGTCIPEGTTCPKDNDGNPTVTCSSDADCAACDQDHQACDTATSKCMACNDNNKWACQPTDHCKDGECKGKCPVDCQTDDDCAQCGTLANSGHACLPSGRCGECSDTVPCGNDTVCGPQGMCIKVCGELEKPKGVCTDDSGCSGCEGDAIKCHTPINGGDGRCGVPAAGCSEIPGNFVVLPDPWSSVTNMCSVDGDCNGVGLNLNVGKILRDLTGFGEINDATVQYGMNVCAALEAGIAGETYHCGVCVPCRVDADCEPIKFDPLVDQMFTGLGGIAAKFIMNEIFGDNPHELNMYCEPVLGEFGVCAPCVDFLHECAINSTSGEECNNHWECGPGEYCTDNTCGEYTTDCFGNEDLCTGGQVCAWNGNGYCCRAPFSGTESCFTDAECAPQVCAYNGTGYFCVDPVDCS